jgi:hypothetical protein
MHPAEAAASNRQKAGKMESLQHSIQFLHSAIAEMPKAETKSKLAAALNQLTTIQAEETRVYSGPERVAN